MAGKKYYLNPETLRFERALPPPGKRAVNVLLLGVGLIILALFMRLGYEHFGKSPRLVYYEKQNESLRNEYEDLDQDLQQDELKLADLKRKDDRLYRSIFGLDPLPSSIREAGTGGSDRYMDLQSISDPEVVIEVSSKLDNIATRARIQSNSFEDLEEQARLNQQLLACKPSIEPISPGDPHWLTSGFGKRIDPFTKKISTHPGIDLAGAYGLSVHVTGDGVV